MRGTYSCSGTGKAVVVLDDSHEGHNDAPRDHHDADPKGGAEDLEDHVAGDFEKGVGKEEDGETREVS